MYIISLYEIREIQNMITEYNNNYSGSFEQKFVHHITCVSYFFLGIIRYFFSLGPFTNYVNYNYKYFAAVSPFCSHPPLPRPGSKFEIKTF